MYFFSSSAVILPPTSSRGVFGFPLPAIEWHMLQCCAAYTCCPLLTFAASGFAASSARNPATPRPTHSATAMARLRVILDPPWRGGPAATISPLRGRHQRAPRRGAAPLESPRRHVGPARRGARRNCAPPLSPRPPAPRPARPPPAPSPGGAGRRRPRPPG